MSETKKVLIIGASACGAKAASRIKRLKPEYDVVIIDQGHYISYAACGMPYYLSGKVRHFEDLLKTTYGRVRDAEYFKDLKDITVHTGLRAVKIDRAARTVHGEHLATGETRVYQYDDLVIAAGAAPMNRGIPGAGLTGVYHLTNMEDAAAIAGAMKEREKGSVVIIGGGFIGVEAAEAFGERRWDVTIIEKEGQLFPGLLDFEIAAMIQEHLYEHTVETVLGAGDISIEGEGGRAASVRAGGKQYAADIVIIAAGIVPEVKIAADAGLAVGTTGALAVDSRLRTNDPAIYAGGDIVENLHLVTGEQCYIPLGSTANKHGRVIADNICGIHSEFPGVQGTFVCKAFAYSVGSTGITESGAKKRGLDAYAFAVAGFDKAHYYPDSQIMALKVVAENGTGRLLGLQAVGRGDVARRVDIAATALRLRAAMKDLVHLDMAYAPPFSSALDVFVTAVNVAGNIKTGMMRPVSGVETRKLLDNDESVIVLDVRMEHEFRRAHIDSPKVINIPLDQLHARHGELPKGKKILCACLLGLRGFTAQRILDSLGYPDVRTVEGGMFLWPWKDDFA
ncbi:MAG TPA: FAD-dependent oxidoreductase [Spirochaetota bacterium]|nr:FAD-dependent oxidoreductase [Spirochaetota bacterium]